MVRPRWSLARHVAARSLSAPRTILHPIRQRGRPLWKRALDCASRMFHAAGCAAPRHVKPQVFSAREAAEPLPELPHVAIGVAREATWKGSAVSQPRSIRMLVPWVSRKIAAWPQLRDPHHSIPSRADGSIGAGPPSKPAPRPARSRPHGRRLAAASNDGVGRARCPMREPDGRIFSPLGSRLGALRAASARSRPRRVGSVLAQARAGACRAAVEKGADQWPRRESRSVPRPSVPRAWRCRERCGRRMAR